MKERLRGGVREFKFKLSSRAKQLNNNWTRNIKCRMRERESVCVYVCERRMLIKLI